MPKVRPIRIPTRGLPWWKRGWVWLFQPRTWELIEDYTYRSDTLKVRLFAPAGTVFDGASIPRFCWWFVTPTGIFFIASLFHDIVFKDHVLQRQLGNGRCIGYLRGCSRAEADNLFKVINNEVNGMPFISWIGWFFLWMFSWVAWDGHRKNVKLEPINNNDE